MTVHDKFGLKNAFALAMGSKGLILALAVAGAVFQGCTTEDKATGPAGTDTPAAIAEDDKGADLNADGSPVHPDNTASAESKAVLAKTAPLCVDLLTVSRNGVRDAQAYNQCGHNVRIRFIWRWNIDSDCIELRTGRTYIDSRQWPSYLSELRSC